MREVAPGDLIFSFMDTRILAVGIAQSYCWESPKPLEFGAAGENWEDIGWRVKVQFTELTNKVRPKDHIEILRPLLPARYSPFQANGNGLQSVYLTEMPTTLAEVLIGLIGQEVAPIALSARRSNRFRRMILMPGSAGLSRGSPATTQFRKRIGWRSSALGMGKGYSRSA